MRVRSIAGRMVAVVAMAAVVLAAYLVLRPPARGHVAMPADDASPAEVVTAYLDALDAHDCDTAEALVASSTSVDAAEWCDDVASVDHVDLGDAFGRGDRRTVPARFDLDWRPLHDDGSMLEGSTTWGYRLVRDGAGGPWRITDQGAA